jgi:hypothetical protein
VRFAIRSAAATLAIRDAVGSHASSAVLATLPVWELPDRPCVTVRPGYTGDALRVHLHRATLDGVVSGTVAPRTRVARTILDIAREHGTEDAVVAGDAALARGIVDEDALMRCARFCEGWPGIRRAYHAIGLLDARSESPLESVSRLRLVEHGIPAPEPQTHIFTLDGVYLGRLDFYWEEFGVAGEVDGRLKYRLKPDEVVWREKRRQELLEDAGLVFARWGRPDLENMPRLVAKVQRTFRRASRRPASDRLWVARSSIGRFAPPMRVDRAS